MGHSLELATVCGHGVSSFISFANYRWSIYSMQRTFDWDPLILTNAINLNIAEKYTSCGNMCMKKVANFMSHCSFYVT